MAVIASDGMSMIATQAVTNTFDRAFNTVERVVGLDLDRDGDIGVMGSANKNGSAVRSTRASARPAAVRSEPPAPIDVAASSPADLLALAGDHASGGQSASSPSTPPVLGSQKVPATKMRV